jgi:hypothetical protein
MIKYYFSLSGNLPMVTYREIPRSLCPNEIEIVFEKRLRELMIGNSNK